MRLIKPGMNTAEKVMPEVGEKLSHLIESVFSPDIEETTLGEVIDALDHHGLAIILILFSIPSALPLPAAGYSTILSVPLFLIAFHFLLGKDSLWLPDWIRKKKFSPAKMSQMTPKLVRLTGFIERFTKPRLVALARSRALSIVLGILIFALACSMLLPIPGTNTAPAFGIFLIGFGLLEDDGVAILLGILAGFVALCLSLAIIFFGYEAVKLVISSVKDLI